MRLKKETRIKRSLEFSSINVEIDLVINPQKEGKYVLFDASSKINIVGVPDIELMHWKILENHLAEKFGNYDNWPKVSIIRGGRITPTEDKFLIGGISEDFGVGNSLFVSEVLNSIYGDLFSDGTDRAVDKKMISSLIYLRNTIDSDELFNDYWLKQVYSEITKSPIEKINRVNKSEIKFRVNQVIEDSLKDSLDRGELEKKIAIL